MTERQEFTLDHYEAGTDEPPEVTADGISLTGLRDISGTFTGVLDMSGPLFAGAAERTVQEVLLYGPDPDLRWWEHWFYRIRERLTGEEYPTVVLATGPANLEYEEHAEEDGTTTFSVTFRSSGQWHLHGQDDEADRP